MFILSDSVYSFLYQTLSQTLESVHTLLRRASEGGAQLVVLGEMFSCPYSHQSFRSSAQSVSLDCGGNNSDDLVRFLATAAETHGMWLVGGSIPELVIDSNGCRLIYNTSLIFDSKGILRAKYRKLHLFDVSIPADPKSGSPGVSFKESDTLSQGDLGLGLFETPWGFDIGIGICYDLRFPELATALRERSANKMKLLVYPGQFNMTTGPMHWELLGRARAVDTQSFCVLASVARSTDLSDYQVCPQDMLRIHLLVLGSLNDYFPVWQSFGKLGSVRGRHLCGYRYYRS